MTVYVDNARIPAHVNGIQARWSHLLADSTRELEEFGRALGLRASWIQHRGSLLEHFDVTDSKRRAAIRLGAVGIDIRDVADLLRGRRERRGECRRGATDQSNQATRLRADQIESPACRAASDTAWQALIRDESVDATVGRSDRITGPNGGRR